MNSRFVFGKYFLDISVGSSTVLTDFYYILQIYYPDIHSEGCVSGWNEYFKIGHCFLVANPFLLIFGKYFRI
jgi:hypothetical protein